MFKTSGGKYVAPQVLKRFSKGSKFIEQIMVVGDGEKMPCALGTTRLCICKTLGRENI